jgi:hypothetical protein
VIGTPHIVADPNCWYYASINPFCRALAPNLTDAFQLEQPGQFGNTGNLGRGPHIGYFSSNLLKDFPIHERTNGISLGGSDEHADFRPAQEQL